MLSLLAVFKDVLPGYRIRLPTEKELAMPVSKDVKRTREYEATLLRLYQVHLHIRDAEQCQSTCADVSATLQPIWVACLDGVLMRAMQAYVRQLTKAAAGAASSADGGAAAALGQIAMHCMQVGCLQWSLMHVATHVGTTWHDV